ncbi:hypothetical protein [Zoogloea sp.]|uniref:hypothetical protein n=1 Tax=Zoogloea sp. TaxID=49181 RepID=UPI001AC1C2AD|nr:hypothetical protein [Zoogloea sp.]MBN8283403.1 hypothetical protein [Zoogloea sp.]
MTTRHSPPVPTSLRQAFDMDKAHANKRYRLTIERLAELMNTTPATLYKWIETDSMPARALLAWQHLTGANNVARYLASAEGGVLIKIPTGKAPTADDVHILQATLNGAIGALLGFISGETDQATTLGKLGAGLESLAWHRANVAKAEQPELEF